MLSLIGIGGAGCRIVDNFYKRNVVAQIITKISSRGENFRGVAVDTSDNITKLNNIPIPNSILIGKSRAKGRGTGVDVELGRKIMSEEAGLVLNTMRKAGFKKPEMLVIFAGLGGGTGTGGISTLVKKTKKVYKVPALGVFILPSKGKGRVYLKNTYLNFQDVISSVDGAIFVDNDVPTKKGEDIPSTYKIVNDSIYNFFMLVMSVEEYLLKNALNKISTIGYAKDKSKDISIKATIERMLRDEIFLKFDPKKCEKMVFIARGDLGALFDQDFARGWVKKKFGYEVEFVFREEPGSRYTEMGLMIIGIKDLSNRFDDVKEEIEEKRRSELDDLLGDIQSIF